MEAEKRKSIAPMDDYLGISNLPFKLTRLAMLEVTFWGQNQCSYQRADEILRKKCGIELNYETIRNVTNYVGRLVFKEDCHKADMAILRLDRGGLDFTNDKKGVLYIQTDGAALNTRTKDETGSTWRENKLGEVFSSDNIYFWTDNKGERQHKIKKKEYVSYVGSVNEFKKHLFACALRGGYGCYEETVILSDGATWIRNMAQEMYPDAQQILDYFHLCENVNDYAKCLFNQNEIKYKPWAKNICTALKNSEHKRVLKELEKSKNKELKNCSTNLFGYICNNVDNIDYKNYEERGYFIGSGAIESGHKLILQQRLKQAGMRWNVETAQPLLTLKCKSESGLWGSDVIDFIMQCNF